MVRKLKPIKGLPQDDVIVVIHAGRVAVTRKPKNIRIQVIDHDNQDRTWYL